MKKIQRKIEFKKISKENFNFITELKKEFPKAEVFLVGGAVRDFFLKQKTKDYDFVIRNVELNNLESFLSRQGTVNLVGQCFGVFKFIPFDGDKENPFDIALPRKDFSFKTGGYRDVEIQTDSKMEIKQDLSRRDFTINAMALKWENFKANNSTIWEVIDPFKGYDDLQKKIIRAVRNPQDRFKEDYSRILRALRLSCQLGFTIEEKTWQALKNEISGLNKINRTVESIQNEDIIESKVLEKRVVPHEVIAKEFLKTFLCDPVQAFELYDQSGAFKELIPELLTMKNCPQPENYHAEGDVWEHTKLALKNLTSVAFQKKFQIEKFSLELIIATLLHDLGKPYTLKTPERDKTDRIRFNEHDSVGAQKAKEIAQRLKLSSPEKLGINIEEMVWLVEQHMILIRGDISKMKNSTIEKYFFHPHFSGEKLLQISFVDISATITQKGPLSFDKFNEMEKRIAGLKKMGKNKKNLPPNLITGHDLMENFKMKPGPQIGKCLKYAREKQLNLKIKSKKQALELLKKHFNL